MITLAIKAIRSWIAWKGAQSNARYIRRQKREVV